MIWFYLKFKEAFEVGPFRAVWTCFAHNNNNFCLDSGVYKIS